MPASQLSFNAFVKRVNEFYRQFGNALNGGFIFDGLSELFRQFNQESGFRQEIRIDVSAEAEASLFEALSIGVGAQVDFTRGNLKLEAVVDLFGFKIGGTANIRNGTISPVTTNIENTLNFPGFVIGFQLNRNSKGDIISYNANLSVGAGVSTKIVSGGVNFGPKFILSATNPEADFAGDFQDRFMSYLKSNGFDTKEANDIFKELAKDTGGNVLYAAARIINKRSGITEFVFPQELAVLGRVGTGVPTANMFQEDYRISLTKVVGSNDIIYRSEFFVVKALNGGVGENAGRTFRVSFTDQIDENGVVVGARSALGGHSIGQIGVVERGSTSLLTRPLESESTVIVDRFGRQSILRRVFVNETTKEALGADLQRSLFLREGVKQFVVGGKRFAEELAKGNIYEYDESKKQFFFRKVESEGDRVVLKSKVIDASLAVGSGNVVSREEGEEIVVTGSRVPFSFEIESVESVTGVGF
jgi:hypothetical protein